MKYSIAAALLMAAWFALAFTAPTEIYHLVGICVGAWQIGTWSATLLKRAGV